jgi:hypothetical protein
MAMFHERKRLITDKTFCDPNISVIVPDEAKVLLKYLFF